VEEWDNKSEKVGRKMKETGRMKDVRNEKNKGTEARNVIERLRMCREVSSH
jgi:hypothetical protein